MSYMDYIYEIIGEQMKSKPPNVFQSDGVYVIIDKDNKMIWVWAGKSSRLFHRYIAANSAGKLKTQKRYYNFRYEQIKEGKEPEAFLTIYNEIKGDISNLKYPGQSRTNMVKFKSSPQTKLKSQSVQSITNLSDLDKNKIKKILNEIKEIQMHVKYSIDHIEKRLREIEKIIE